MKAEVSGSPHNPARDGSAPIQVCERGSVSNRNSKLLEFPLRYRKQRIGQFLIATFRDFSRLVPVRLPHARSAGSPKSSPHSEAIRLGNHSTRLRKLENQPTHVQSVTSMFLIDNFDALVRLSPAGPQKSILRSRTRSRFSSRKLENRPTIHKSATSKFLVDNFHWLFESLVPRIFRKRPPQPELHRASKVTSILISERQEDS